MFTSEFIGIFETQISVHYNSEVETKLLKSTFFYRKNVGRRKWHVITIN